MSKSKQNTQSIDIIQETRKLVKGMDQKSRFEIAKKHLENALGYKTPRLDTYSENMPRVFRACYNIQTSNMWQIILLTLSYIFMYLVIWTHSTVSQQFLIVESIILILMWIDVIMEIHHKSYEVLRLTSRFQLRFYVRIITLMLLLADEVIVYAIPDWTIRPFLIFRCCNYIFICSAPHFLRLQCQEGFLSAVVSLQRCACIFVLLYLRHCWVRYCCQPNYTTSRRCWLRPTIE